MRNTRKGANAVAKMGRPPKKIDQQQFEGMCQIQATYEEICLVLGVSDKTLNAWCRKTYGTTFSDIFKQKREIGKISLRRKQWKLAEKNATMAIFLGKQYLGQRDYSEVEVKADINNPFDGVSTEDIKKLIGEE